MAIRQEIIIEAKEVGIDATTAKIKNLNKATEEVSATQGGMASSMKGSSAAVLENGGAMGLLNDLTGGVAMQIKDAVEASVLFTKSQKIQAIQTKLTAGAQAVYTAVVGTSTGALKIFKLALAATGIGLIVIAIGLLVANFDKVKEAVMKLIPGLSIVGDIFGELINFVTDFVGATSNATRELDKLVAASEKSLKKNQDFLATDADKYDQYTKQKIQAIQDFNNAVKDANEDETKTTEEKLVFIQKLRDRADREVLRADEARATEQQKKEKEKQDKLNDIAKKAQDKKDALAKQAKDKADALAKEAAEKEKARLDAIEAIEREYQIKKEDRLAKSELDKINLEEKRKLAELDKLRATLEEKESITQYYDSLRLENQMKLDQELALLEQSKIEANRELELDQKEWLIENELDPVLKLEKQRELLEEQAQLDLDKMQVDRDNLALSLAERTQADINYVARKQELNQALADNETALAEQKKIRDKAVADNQFDVASQTLSLIGGLAKQGSSLAKGVAVAQATMDTYKGAVSAYAAGSSVGGPAGVVLGPVMAGLAVAAGFNNIKNILKTKPVETSAPSGGASAPSAPSLPSAPSFNLVQGTGSNQIAQSIAGQNKPLQAYVVSSNVTNAQALDRNIIQNASL